MTNPVTFRAKRYPDAPFWALVCVLVLSVAALGFGLLASPDMIVVAVERASIVASLPGVVLLAGALALLAKLFTAEAEYLLPSRPSLVPDPTLPVTVAAASIDWSATLLPVDVDTAFAGILQVSGLDMLTAGSGTDMFAEANPAAAASYVPTGTRQLLAV